MAKKSKNNAPKPRPVAPAAALNAGTGPMDPELLERLVQIMSANDISSLDLRDGAQRVSLKRGPQQVSYSAAPTYAAPQAASVAPSHTAANAQATPTASSAAADDESSFKQIKSPMVGTFYASSSPDSKAFVQVGSVVNEETDICIIEAMKVFNNIKAETRGTIAKICVENGKTVEFGTVLFLVKP